MPSSTVYNKPQTIESFLEPVERVPERYVIQGSIRMLQKPIQLSDHDLRSPRQIATLEIAASSPVIVHSVVRIAGKPEQQFICEKFYEDGNIKVLLDETYEAETPEGRAPTVLPSSILVALGLLSSHRTWSLWLGDITGAYMLAKPTRKYAIRAPRGWNDFCARAGRKDCQPFSADEVWYVLKNLYGSVDAARVWFLYISNIFIAKLGFTQCPIDRCVFRLLDEKGSVCIILLYVDDILILGDQELSHHIQTMLKTLVPITDSGMNYLGIEIDHDPAAGRVRVTQKGYAQKVLESLGMSDCRPVKTPLPTDFTATVIEAPNGGLPKGAAEFETGPFRSALGMLMFLATRTRPDLLFTVGVLATVSAPSASCPEAPCPGHRAALQRSLRYLAGSVDLGLLFQRMGKITLEAWCDASHGREIHHTASGYCKSTSGGFITLNMAVVSAFSAIQGATALSTFEAELYALVQVTRLVLALRHLISFLIGITLPPTVIHCDNNSVLLQLKRQDLSARSRHIRVHLGLIFDALEANEIDAQFIRSGENPSNAMTAAEDRDRFARSVDVMTGRPPEGPPRDMQPHGAQPHTA